MQHCSSSTTNTGHLHAWALTKITPHLPRAAQHTHQARARKVLYKQISICQADAPSADAQPKAKSPLLPPCSHLLLAKVVVLGVEVHQLRLWCAHGLGTRTSDAVKGHVALTTDVEHLQGWGGGSGRWGAGVVVVVVEEEQDT